MRTVSFHLFLERTRSGTVRRCLLLVYMLAYVVPAYWCALTPGSVTGKLCCLLLTVSGGLLWAHLAAGEVTRGDGTGSPRTNWETLALPAAFLLLLNAGALCAVIPWRGDEELLVGFNFAFIDWVAQHPLQTATLQVAVVLAAVLAGPRPVWSVLLIAAVAAGAACAHLLVPPPSFYPIMRYPFLARLPHAVAPFISSLFGRRNIELFHRVIPCLAMLGTAIVVARNPGRTASRSLRVTWFLAVTTMPLLVYYASTAYIETVAVLLMTLAAADIERLVQEDFDGVRRRPAWYALLLVGFIKETTATFLCAYVLARLYRLAASAVREGRAPERKVVLDEVKLVFCVSLPLLVYLVFRGVFCATNPGAEVRGTELPPAIRPLLMPSTYLIYCRAFWDQIGALLAFFTAGLVLLWRRRSGATVIFLLSAFLLPPFVHSIDYMGVYAGYSRFNLFVVPPVLAGALIAVRELCAKVERRKVVALLAGVVLLNLVMTPLNLDGTKKPFWGNYRVDTAEHYYPYRRVIRWLLTDHADEQKVLFLSRFRYPTWFYFGRRSGPKPYSLIVRDLHEAAVLERTLRTARTEGFRIVVINPHPSESGRLPERVGPFGRLLFSNDAHTLAVYLDAALFIKLAETVR